MKDYLYPLRVLHGKIHEWRIHFLPLMIERMRNPAALYLVLTPEHGNLGDHAIAQSEKEILNSLNLNYIEVTGRMLEEWQRNNCIGVMNGRPILINGGGNLGDLWPEVEKMMQTIVVKNPKSPIIIFPNTIYYEMNSDGIKRLEESKKVYNSHRRLKMYAREMISYKMMSSVYTNVKLMPDMVLRLNKCNTEVARSGCILCLRSDIEKTISKKEEQQLLNQVHTLFGNNVKYLDMICGDFITVENRERALDVQYDLFRHSELVITDRLHGMIFSAITGTPCIVINSKSPKVLGCYEWIKDLEYIRVANDVNDIETEYRKIPKKQYKYNSDVLQHYYDELGDDILKLISK